MTVCCHPGLAIVRYRTLVDRFRTQNSKVSSRYILFTSCTHEHLYHLVRGSPVKNAGQVQRMAIILHQEKVV